MTRLKNYLSECYSELATKVSWPTWRELQESAIVVLIAAMIIGLIVFLMDTVFQGTMNFIYSIFS
jgi:preprotein translocase subunit SecE